MYLIGRPSLSTTAALHSFLKSEAVNLIRGVGGARICVRLADLDEEIRALNPGRLMGKWSEIGAILSFWIDSEHLRSEVESALQEIAPKLAGYLVTEAVWQAEGEEVLFDGSRRSGISQMGGLSPPASMNDDQFFNHWEEHSRLSFVIHPLRDAYTRHTVVRALTQDAPPYRALVLEHFPSIDIFCDDAKFNTGDVAARDEINRHVSEMIDFRQFFSGAMSEYNY